MAVDRDTLYFVCTNCGWIEDRQRPEKCPNCQYPAEAYQEVK
jgi:rubrerythrin